MLSPEGLKGRLGAPSNLPSHSPPHNAPLAHISTNTGIFPSSNEGEDGEDIDCYLVKNLLQSQTYFKPATNGRLQSLQINNFALTAREWENLLNI